MRRNAQCPTATASLCLPLWCRCGAVRCVLAEYAVATTVWQHIYGVPNGKAGPPQTWGMIGPADPIGKHRFKGLGLPSSKGSFIPRFIEFLTGKVSTALLLPP